MNKIQALELTIFNLENNVYVYYWASPNHCNCGILARTLLGGKYPSNCGYADSPTEEPSGTFSSNAFCITTNLPLPEVFQVLKDAGFTHQELLELEYLENEKIAGIMWRKLSKTLSGCIAMSNEQYANKSSLILYLKAWVGVLKEEEQTPISTPQVKEKTVYVAVPVSIKEQAKELILS